MAASCKETDRFDEIIASIGGKSSQELEAMGFEPLSVGFANVVSGWNDSGRQRIVKRYTDLILLRISPEAIGAIDVYAGETGAGPRVLHSTQQGLVEERLPGDTLREVDMHKGDTALLDQVAKAVAGFHESPVPALVQGEPMLWRTVDKMLEVVEASPHLIPPGMLCLSDLRAEVSDARSLLEHRHPKLVLGHGDLKPSNVVFYDGVATLIDFELGGPNYRGFDLMKLFRTDAAMSEASMEHFFRSYVREVQGCKETPAEVAAEARAFLPLTWLEAAVFFLTLPQFKPDETARWNTLAVDRWGKYMETKHLLSAPSADASDSKGSALLLAPPPKVSAGGCACWRGICSLWTRR